MAGVQDHGASIGLQTRRSSWSGRGAYALHGADTSSSPPSCPRSPEKLLSSNHLRGYLSRVNPRLWEAGGAVGDQAPATGPPTPRRAVWLFADLARPHADLSLHQIPGAVADHRRRISGVEDFSEMSHRGPESGTHIQPCSLGRVATRQLSGHDPSRVPSTLRLCDVLRAQHPPTNGTDIADTPPSSDTMCCQFANLVPNWRLHRRSSSKLSFRQSSCTEDSAVVRTSPAPSPPVGVGTFASGPSVRVCRWSSTTPAR